MEEGDVVVCVSIDEEVCGWLTIGKQYTVIYEELYSSTVKIVDDEGDKTLFYKHMFLTLPEYREQKLNKLV
jgi:hypothetical protein